MPPVFLFGTFDAAAAALFPAARLTSGRSARTVARMKTATIPTPADLPTANRAAATYYVYPNARAGPG